MTSLVYVKNKKAGRTYVYENVSIWDKEKKKCKCIRKCIGHLDPESGEIVPNRRKKSTKEQKTTGKVAIIGNTILFDHICDTVGLKPVLKEVFPNEWQKILTCAYYILSEGKALSHCETWSASHKTPYDNTLIDQRISELLVTLTREHQLEFFNAWIKHHMEKEYLALDITSVSSYSQQNEYVRYGYNRDREKLPQINLCMLLGQDSKVPLYYEILPGSIRDVSALKNIIKTLDWLKAKRLHFVMDKGFCSEKNIDDLYDSSIRFLLGMSFTSSFTKECVSKARKDINHFENYRYILGDDVFVKSWLSKWKGHRCYVHVYYDSAKADGEYRAFLRKLNQYRDELESKNEVKSHQHYYDNFFVIKETPVRGRKVSFNKKAIEEYRNGTAGYFVLISNDIKDSVRALEVYRNKDSVEKGFDNLKNSLDCRRLRVHSESAMEGRMFLQFISLVIASRIQKVMSQENLYKRYTMPEIINELKTFQEIQIKGKREKIYTELTKSQKDLLEVFGINIDSYV